MNKRQGGAIEITPEMVKAGSSALVMSGYNDSVADDVTAENAVIEVFEAMLSASGQKESA